jgi:hypothetical protein
MYAPPQTLSRLHVCATLVLAQIIGSICVMVARATAPNAIGPGTVFPNVGTWDFSDGLSGSPMASAPFWIALICQIVIVLGYFWFYRKEQLCMYSSFLVAHDVFVDACPPKPGHDTDVHTVSFLSSLLLLVSSPTLVDPCTRTSSLLDVIYTSLSFGFRLGVFSLRTCVFVFAFFLARLLHVNGSGVG